MSSSRESSLESIVALAKRRGFVYQTNHIYGGLNGVYDYGHLGVLLKENIKTSWLSSLKSLPYTILRFDGALLGSQALWEASGHINNFHDPMIDCKSCKHRFRADDIDPLKSCTRCGNKDWTDVRSFDLMFKTQLGAMEGDSHQAYLRPETAQTLFAQFKNIITSNRVKLPFGVSQIGKAFRNEITPKQFLFRMREFEQMELEIFCTPKDSNKIFQTILDHRTQFYNELGFTNENLVLAPATQDDLAHYAQACTDIEYRFPFGVRELEGIAHRSNFDLTQHSDHSGKQQAIQDPESGASIIPTVIEASVGLDRIFLALLCEHYHVETVDEQERTVLTFPPSIAPIKAAFFPLSKEIAPQMEAIFTHAAKKTGYELTYDGSGSIGKRYRRQDEIGTPLCFTYDFESDTDQCVTVRHRDTLAQKRISIDQIVPYLQKTVTNHS